MNQIWDRYTDPQNFIEFLFFGIVIPAIVLFIVLSIMIEILK